MLRREIWKTSVSNDVREVKTLIYNFDNVKLKGDMTNNEKIKFTLYRAENALSVPVTCRMSCKNCDTMRDSFAKTMRIFARNYAQVFAQKRDVENAIVLHKLCINLSPFASRFLHGILH